MHRDVWGRMNTALRLTFAIAMVVANPVPLRAQTPSALTASSGFLSPVGMAQAERLLGRSAAHRNARMRQYFLIKSAVGRWQVAKSADLASPNSERILVDPVDRRVMLYIDHIGSEFSLPWCDGPTPAGRTKRGYIACTSNLMRPHPTQTNTSGEQLMLVDKEALFVAIEESSLAAFVEQDVGAEREEFLRRQRERSKNNARFQSALRPGTETNLGMVIELKPPLVKIQSPNLAVGERWYRLEEVLPPR